MKKKKESVFSKYAVYLKNKYILTFLGFLVWMSFFDRNDFITTWEYRSRLSTLQQDKAYYEEKIRENKAYLNELRTNRQNMEKYGRERYFMKRDNEEVFVILDRRSKNRK